MISGSGAVRAVLRNSALSLLATFFLGCQSTSQVSSEKQVASSSDFDLSGMGFDLLDRPFQKVPTSGCFLSTKITFAKNLATITQKYVGPCPHVAVVLEPREFLLDPPRIVSCNWKLYDGKQTVEENPQLISITDTRKRERKCGAQGLGDLSVKIKKADGSEEYFYTPDR